MVKIRIDTHMCMSAYILEIQDPRMALTGGYCRLTKDQEGSIKDYYMDKDCKNKWKLETSRRRGWLIFHFMKSIFSVTAKDWLHSLGSCLEQLNVCMESQSLFR